MTHKMRYSSGTRLAHLTRFSTAKQTHFDTHKLVSTNWRIRTSTLSRLEEFLKNSFARFFTLLPVDAKAPFTGFTNVSVSEFGAHSLKPYSFTAKNPIL